MFPHASVAVHVLIITSPPAQAPELIGVPSDITVECGNIPTVPSNITATDNCDDQVTVTLEEIRTDGACADGFALVRTWTAIDACGNEAEASQIITVTDESAPVITQVPEDITIDCNAPIPAGNVTGVIVSDNCDSDIEITFEDQEENNGSDCTAGGTIIRTYTATDNLLIPRHLCLRM